MSQNGLHYATDRYDIARYERMRQIAAEVLSMIAAPDETGDGPSAAEFHRSLLETVGGYWTDTVGEDFELTLRLHRHLRERGEPYRIAGQA